MDVSPQVATLSLLLLTATSLPSWGQDYRAPLRPVNPEVTQGVISGHIRLVQRGDRLKVNMEVKGLAPDMMHLQHLHGSRDGMNASCAPAVAETGQDEVVDLIDTRPHSGVTLIPLHDDPASLEIKTDTYPVSNRGGSYTYQQTINWPRLKQAVADEYGIEDLNLRRMVVYVHGVPEGSDLPDSVRSLPGVPAHMTLPVACGEFDIQPTQH